MFSEYLDSHPMLSLLSDAEYRLFPTAEDRTAWNSLPSELAVELRQMTQIYQTQPVTIQLCRFKASKLHCLRTAAAPQSGSGGSAALESEGFARAGRACA